LCAILAAVPAGEYVAKLSLDLTPLFGPIGCEKSLTITPPPPEAVERRLADLEDQDPVVRRAAVQELPYFSKDGKRVGEALGRCLLDEDGIVRRLALASLQGWPDVAAARCGEVLGILEDGTGRAPGERTNAALLASRTAPVSDRARSAFDKALREATPREKPILESALEFYRKRAAQASGD
jgi:HEAT repeat protein